MKTLPTVKIESRTFLLPCQSYNAIRATENAATDELAKQCEEIASLQEGSWADAITDPRRLCGGLNNESGKKT